MTLVRWNSAAIVLSCLAAAIGVIVRGDIGLAFDIVALLLLATLPTLRVAVLTASWVRAGDLRFALSAIALLVVMTLGTVLVMVFR